MIGCIWCASIIIIALVILIIFLLFQIIWSINIPEISDYTGDAQIQLNETISGVVSNNNSIIEQIRVLLLSIIDWVYSVIRGTLE